MFSAFVRLVARRAPGAVVCAGGATALTANSFPKFLHCDEGSGIRTAGGGVPINIGKQFLQLYHAEFEDKPGKINLHASLTFDQAKQMLIAAGAKPKHCKEMWDLMDTDSSGRVDFCEIIVFFLNQGKGALQDKGSLFFNACDIDGSKTIEFPELKEIIHHMMLLKKDTQGRDSFMSWHPMLFAGIPETYVLHYKANELAADIFATAGKNNAITEKQFQTWLGRGGKQVNRLCSLFGI